MGAQSKRLDTGCYVSLVASQDALNNFALVFITKKNKKIDTVLPLTAELQIEDQDRLNFVCHWDPKGFESPQGQLLSAPPASSAFRVRVVCNHAGEKETLLQRIVSIKQYVPCEPNTFAAQRSHGWVWHYQTMVPKCVQSKHVGSAEEEERQDRAKTQDKLKETIELIKSSNKSMSTIAMNIFVKQELEKRQHEFVKYKELSILTYTWNVNGQKPPTEPAAFMDDIFTVRNLSLDV